MPYLHRRDGNIAHNKRFSSNCIQFYFRNSRIIDGSRYFLRLAFFTQILMLVFLMFDGNPYTSLVQIPAFMIAGYIITTRKAAGVAEAA